MATLIENAFPIFTDLDGSPLDGGYIFIGEPGLNPLNNPLQAYWDQEFTAPATNIRTRDGVPYNNGAPGRLYVADQYSILVQNKRGETVYSLAESLGSTPGTGDSSDISPNILTWDAATTYILPGEDVVQYNGFVFVNISTIANLGNNPLKNPDLWYKVPSFSVLLNQHYQGDMVYGGSTLHNDQDSLNYLQNMSLGQYVTSSGVFYNAYKVCLDGTVVTGDADLEMIFDIGGPDEYFRLDLYAPDNAGTRTLVDMGIERGTRYIVIVREVI